MLSYDRESHDLDWHFNESPAAIANLQSRWPDMVVERAPQRSPHQVYVPSGSHTGKLAYQFDPGAIYAAERDRPILAALRLVGPEVFHLLWLRFGQLLPECRESFGLANPGGMTLTKAKPLDLVRHRARRGVGNLAHLTPAIIEAWSNDRSRLDVEPWTDRLGQRLRQGKAADAAERLLGTVAAQQCQSFELRALGAYRKACKRVPETVQRRALARMT